MGLQSCVWESRSSGIRVGKMQVLGIVLVRTLRRLGIELQCWMVELLEPNFARVKAGHCELAHEPEKCTAVFFAGTRFVFVGEPLEQGSLLFVREVDKPLPQGSLAVSVQPR